MLRIEVNQPESHSAKQCDGLRIAGPDSSVGFLAPDGWSRWRSTPRKVAHRRGVRIDFVGLALLALTFGPLQVLLDKGEEDDWFQSHFIVAFATIALVAFIVGVIWELYQRDPVVDLRLFKNRNFAASSVLMFALGFLLYATTVLLPEGAIAFLFVPINTVSYAGIKKEQNNQVSSLMNLMRNIGASTGISLTGVMVTERAQFHQAELVQSATNYSPHLHAAIQNLSGLLGPAGLSTPDAVHQASSPDREPCWCETGAALRIR